MNSKQGILASAFQRVHTEIPISNKLIAEGTTGVSSCQVTHLRQGRAITIPTVERILASKGMPPRANALFLIAIADQLGVKDLVLRELMND